MNRKNMNRANMNRKNMNRANMNRTHMNRKNMNRENMNNMNRENMNREIAVCIVGVLSGASYSSYDVMMLYTSIVYICQHIRQYIMNTLAVATYRQYIIYII